MPTSIPNANHTDSFNFNDDPSAGMIANVTRCGVSSLQYPATMLQPFIYTTGMLLTVILYDVSTAAGALIMILLALVLYSFLYVPLFSMVTLYNTSSPCIVESPITVFLIDQPIVT